MARIEMTGETPEDPAVSAIFDEVRVRGWKVPNLYKTLGASPEMLRAWVDFAWAVRLNAKTPRALRELMIMRGAQVSGAAYEWAHHWPMALDAGVTEAQLTALDGWRESDLFSDAERAALRLTDEVAAGPGASEAAIEALKAFFGPAEVVELTLTAGFYVCVSRTLASLGVEVEDGYRHLLKTDGAPPHEPRK